MKLPVSLPYFISLLRFVPFASAFDRDACFNKTQNLLHTGILPPNSPLFFRDSLNSPLYNGVDNMTLTLQGCNELCGTQQTWYKDIGPRMTIWLIPILLLVANMELSPLDKGCYQAILHLLGDPIDSMWSLLHKLDAWDRCARLAEQWNDGCPFCNIVIASVFGGHEEVQGSRIRTEHYFQALVRQRGFITNFSNWRHAAVRFADGRTNELSRTLLALALYIFQLVAAFVPQVGGAPPGPPGGRIATGVLLAWLVPAILVSNAVGNLPSRRTAYDVLADLATSTGEETLQVTDLRSTFLPSFPSLARTLSTEYFHTLAWSGAIYTYRPWKLRYITHTPHPHLHTLRLIIFAAAPVLIGLVGGILILWYQLPVGPNCRHIWLIGVGIFWNVSAFITWLTYRNGFATGVYHWRFTLIKDACVAIPSFLMMFLSGAGLFNFCWCWSGPFQYRGQGRVPLPETVYLKNARSVYPTIVGVTLVAELVVVVAAAVVWRRGLRLLRWSEKTRREQWNGIMGYGSSKCRCNVGRSRELSLASEMCLLKHDGSMSTIAEVNH